MGRVGSVLLVCSVTAMVAVLPGCGKKSSGVAATTINISPSSLSLEQGKYSGLSVTDGTGAAVLASRVTWRASDSSALSVGLLAGVPTACAGVWDSLTAPTVCTPGPAETLQLTATANSSTSAPITVYVHAHIERLETCLVGTGTCPNPAPSTPCLSAPSQFAAAGSADYQVVASNNGNDITSTIGPITWNTVNSTVVTLVNSGNGLLSNQVRATAKAPGQTSFFATAGGATSAPLTFTTCPVAAIALATSTGGNSLTFPKGAPAQAITATVTDAAGLVLTNPPITWSSSNPTVAAVSTTGIITGAQTGTAAVTASCLPTNCNLGLQPASAPIYPPVGIGVTVTGAASNTTIYAASSGCWDRTNGPVLGCLSAIIPIAQMTNTPGAPIALPNTPTSMLISESGTEIYVGSCVPRTAGGPPVCNGIAVVSSAGAVTTNNSVTGDVVGVSANGAKAVVADTSTTPDQVFLYDQASNSGTQLLLSPGDHAKSAVFSADAFLVYISTYRCTASPCQASNEVAGPVYVFDSFNQLRKLSAPTGVTAAAFYPSNGFVYLVQAANAVTALNTCSQTGSSFPLPGTPQFLRALPATAQFIALNGPNAPDLEIITSSNPSGSGCAQTVANTSSPLIDLGQGPLDATQFLLSSDASTAYVIPRNFSSVFSYSLQSQLKGGISLTGSQPPTTGGLTTDGAFLYVGGTDGLVHVLNTAFSGDTLQISPVSGSTNPTTAMCSISTVSQPCNPDFVLVKP